MQSLLPLEPNQDIHHAGLSESANIPKLLLLTSCNLPQNPPHDLSAPSLGQPRSPVDNVRHCKGANSFSDMFQQHGPHVLVMLG